MASIFSTKKPTQREILRESKRDLTSAQRGIEKEIIALQTEEKKLIVEIKKAAKLGDKASARTLAKNLVRIRNQVTKLHSTQVHVRGMSSKVQAAHSNHALAGALKSSGQAIGAMNKQVSPADTMKMLHQFQVENARMETAQESMDSVLDDVLDEEGVDEEAEDYTNQILDEIGVSTLAQMSSAPRSKIRQGTEEEDSSGEELLRRLQNLKS